MNQMKLHAIVLSSINAIIKQILEDTEDCLPFVKADAPVIMQRCFKIIKTPPLSEPLRNEMRYLAFFFFYHMVDDPKLRYDHDL